MYSEERKTYWLVADFSQSLEIKDQYSIKVYARFGNFK
jgi:hypothetical protein